MHDDSNWFMTYAGVIDTASTNHMDLNKLISIFFDKEIAPDKISRVDCICTYKINLGFLWRIFHDNVII